jgi:hypothetical protein
MTDNRINTRNMNPIQKMVAKSHMMTDINFRKTAELFVGYAAIKSHFSPSSHYDFFRYRGKMPADVVLNLWNRNDFKMFESVQRVYPNAHDMLNLFVSNFIVDHKIWIGNLIDDKVCEERLNRWNMFDVSPYYHFESDIKSILGGIESKIVARCLEKSKTESYPRLVQKLLDREICLQSFIILYNLNADIRIGIDHMLMTDVFWKSKFARNIKTGYPFVMGMHQGFKGTLYSAVERLDISQLEYIILSNNGDRR